MYDSSLDSQEFRKERNNLKPASGVSRSLRLNEKSQDSAFSKYLQIEARARAAPLIIIQAILLILNILSSKHAKNTESSDLHNQITVLWLPASILSVVTLILSHKWTVFAELLLQI